MYQNRELRLHRRNVNAFGGMGATFVFWSFSILKNTRTGFTTQAIVLPLGFYKSAVK